MGYHIALARGLPLALILQYAASVQTDRGPVPVGLCQVLTSPARYNEKVLSVEGILSPSEHSLALYNPSCRRKEGFNVSIQAVLPPARESLQNGKRLKKILRRYKDAHVALTGTFESGSGPYGPDVAQFRFSVSEIVSVENAPKVPGR
jgi:hypothetical protein